MRSKWVLFLVLIVLIGITYFSFQEEEKSKILGKKLIDVDVSQVNRVVIDRYPEPSFELFKENDIWFTDLYGNRVVVDSGSVHYTIEGIAQIESSNLISQNPQKWSEYKVDSTGLKVEFYTNSEKIFSIIIGDFVLLQTPQNAPQQAQQRTQPQTMNYFRLENQDEVFSTQNFSIFLIAGQKEFIDRNIFKGKKEDISRIRYINNMEKYDIVFYKTDSLWYGNYTEEKKEMLLSQEPFALFLNKITELRGVELAQEDTEVKQHPKIQIQINTISNRKTTIDFWEHSDSTFVVRSSENENVFFIFKDKDIDVEEFYGVYPF